MKRRTFIKTSAAAAAATAMAPAILRGKTLFKTKPNNEILGAPEDNILIILELFGGNDGLNTIVPAYNDDYYRLRKTIGIPINLLDEMIKDRLYFNPMLSKDVVNGGFKNLFENGNLAIVEGIGFEPINLSHFRAQDIWLSGINSSDASVPLLEGWLGRYLAMKQPNYPMEVPEHPIAMQIGGTLSLLFKSQKGDMGIAVNDIDSFYELATGLTPIESLMPGANNYQNEFNFVHVIARQAEMYASEVKKAYDIGINEVNGNLYTDGLAQKFKTIAALIAGGLKTQIYYVNLSNFDSHAQQQDEITDGTLTGQHPTLLKQVADSISGFMADAVNLGFADRVAGMTMSEFGRRAYDNGSRGTDHGAGSVQFVFGGQYVEGNYYGDLPKLKDEELIDGNLAISIDYRRSMAEFLRVWFGASESEIEDVFKTGGELDLSSVGFLKERPSAVNDDLAATSGNELFVYPNPSPERPDLRFELKRPAAVEINIYDIKGRLVSKVFSGNMPAGFHNLPLEVNTVGVYICSAVINNRRYSTQFTIIK